MPDFLRRYLEKPQGSPLLVIFSSFVSSGKYQNMFDFRKIVHSEEFGCNYLFVKDRKNSWYFQGVDGFSNCLEETVKQIKLEQENIGASCIITLGYSMGGYAALLHGCLLSAQKIITISPQTYVDVEKSMAILLESDPKFEESKRLFPILVKRYGKYFDLGNVLHDGLNIDFYYGQDDPADIYYVAHLKNHRYINFYPQVGCHNAIKQMRECDIGSSSTRCTAFEDNRIVAQEQVIINGTECSALEICEIVDNLVTECLGQLGRKCVVSNVGFASFVGNWIGVDARGKPVTKIYSYDCNSLDAVIGARELREELGNDLGGVYQRTGVPVHSAYMPAQLKNAKVERVARWQTLSSMIIARWTGESVAPVGISEASWTGFLDFRQCRWDEQMCRLAGVDLDQMPEIADFDEPLEGLKARYQKKWPSMKNAQFHPGLADGLAVMSKYDTPVVTIGTSAAARVLVEEIDEIPTGLWCYRVSRKTNRFLLGGALTDGGSLYKWVHDNFKVNGLDKYVPDNHGLTVLPFLRGERSPGWSDNASLMIAGMGEHTSPDQVLQACMEAVVLRLNKVIKLLPRTDELIGTGTALVSSGVWQQMLADVTDCTLDVMMDGEETTWGLAKLMGVSKNAKMISVTARLQAHRAYQVATVRQDMFYGAIYGPQKIIPEPELVEEESTDGSDQVVLELSSSDEPENVEKSEQLASH